MSPCANTTNVALRRARGILAQLTTIMGSSFYYTGSIVGACLLALRCSDWELESLLLLTRGSSKPEAVESFDGDPSGLGTSTLPGDDDVK